jgi:hypothetical protein
MVIAAKGVAFPNLTDLLVDESWLEILGEELQKQYVDNLYKFVLEEASGKFPIYPPPARVFNAFNTCPFNSVKVVILGQVGTLALLWWGHMVTFQLLGFLLY